MKKYIIHYLYMNKYKVLYKCYKTTKSVSLLIQQQNETTKALHWRVWRCEVFKKHLNSRINSSRMEIFIAIPVFIQTKFSVVFCTFIEQVILYFQQLPLFHILVASVNIHHIENQYWASAQLLYVLLQGLVINFVL